MFQKENWVNTAQMASLSTFVLFLFIQTAFGASRYAIFPKTFASLDFTTGEVTAIAQYPDYQFFPTCTSNGTDFFSAAVNYSVATNPQTLIGLNGTGAVKLGNVTLPSGSSRVLFSRDVTFVMTTGGYLYNFTAGKLVLISSSPPSFSVTSAITLDEPHSRIWIASTSIIAFNYAIKTYLSISNQYLIQSIAYDKVSQTVFGLAPAAGNALLYQIDQLLNWKFVGVIWGKQLLTSTTGPGISIFNDGYLVFVGTTPFSTNVVTVNVSSLAIISQPLLRYPIPIVALC